MGVERMKVLMAAAGVTTLLLGLPLDAAGMTPACKGLKGDQRATAQRLLGAMHPYDCCDGSISECLKAKKVCRLALRLADNICRRVSRGQSEKEIRRVISRRARSMVAAGKKASIVLRDVPEAGDPNAPVAVVEYACARCPFCAKITPELHREVVSGRLKGKVKLYFRNFPIRYHKHSKEAGLAFVAASRMGKFWPFLLHAYSNFDAFSVERLRPWARFVGMDCEKFALLMKSGETRKLLVQSKKEGLRNRVDATPTFFIDGRRYVGELKAEELVDVLQEAYEGKKGLRYR